MKTVLMLSRFFPPAFDIGGKRAYRFAKYLGQFGWRAVVVTERVPTERRIDETPLDLPPEVEVVRTYLPAQGRFYGNAGTDGTNPAPVAARTGGPTLADQLRWPIGSDIRLAPRFARMAKGLAEKYKPDALFASSSPYTALVFGAVLKKRLHVPLCLDLRDPWTLNFLQAGKPAWARRLDARVERRLFEYADQVTLTCRSARDAYRALYPHLPTEKIQSIYNSFDPSFRVPARLPAPGPVRLVHFGNCYGARSIAPILRALAALKQRDALGPTGVCVQNFGRFSAEDLALAQALGLESLLEVAPVVDYHTGIERLAAADLQVLLGYGEHTLFVPAKFYDYALSGAPILCIAPESELSEMVRGTGRGLALEAEDVAGIEGAITAAIRRRTTPQPPAAGDIDQYAAPETARQLAALLDRMTQGSPP